MIFFLYVKNKYYFCSVISMDKNKDNNNKLI